MKTGGEEAFLGEVIQKKEIVLLPKQILVCPLQETFCQYPCTERSREPCETVQQEAETFQNASVS